MYYSYLIVVSLNFELHHFFARMRDSDNKNYLMRELNVNSQGSLLD